jgi:hypothetical protein
MSGPSNDVGNISESATHDTAQGSCTPSSPRRNNVLTAERATYSGSIDSSAITNLHDITRVGNQETPDSPGFGDVDTTSPREEIRAPSGALRAANTAASPVSIPQTADSYREPRAQVSQETHSGPQVGQAQTSTLDEEMVDSERTLPLNTESSATNSQEFLDWKAQGHPLSSRCLKQHFGRVCNTTQWESDLLKRDPEGYARYRKRMAKPASRRNAHQNRVANTQSQPHQRPRQHRETSGDQDVSDIGTDPRSPFLLQYGADVISKCSSASELENMQRICAQHPELAVMGQMAAAARQGWRAAEAHYTASQIADNPQQDSIADETATSPPPALASDDATPAATSSTNGPSIDFRTGADLAFNRNIEQGGPSARAEGKQPKK